MVTTTSDNGSAGAREPGHDVAALSLDTWCTLSLSAERDSRSDEPAKRDERAKRNEAPSPCAHRLCKTQPVPVLVVGTVLWLWCC
jgi:hypothetical protein